MQIQRPDGAAGDAARAGAPHQVRVLPAALRSTLHIYPQQWIPSSGLYNITTIGSYIFCWGKESKGKGISGQPYGMERRICQVDPKWKMFFFVKNKRRKKFRFILNDIAGWDQIFFALLLSGEIIAGGKGLLYQKIILYRTTHEQ
jgi:hypothetical protein